MDIVKVQEEINLRISWLEALLKKLDDAGQKKADATANYDVTFAVAMAKLVRGKITQIDGEPLPENIPATAAAKYAAGICRKEKADLEIATNAYKSLLTKIETTKATLNAKQSIFRHLSHEVQ
jgi:hypothetical protein